MTRIITALFLAVAACFSCSAQEVKDSTKLASHDNLHSTHYLLMPNGFGLKRGEAYYQNALVMLNQFGIGVTDKISVSMGTIPIYFFGADVIPFWVAPKISLPLGPKVSLGGGVMYMFTYYGGDGDDVIGGWDTGGLAFGSLTVGSRDRNTSIGFGYGITGDRLAQQPLLTISHMRRMGRRGYLLTENFIFLSSNNTFGIVSLGGRIIISRLGLDFGMAAPVGLNGFVAIPWLGFTVPLGKPH
ncbi:MAG TPA: hypothetical protein VFE50_00630 [Cyclobacteriaceae bacterium]|nr:hypothetical protein [Cyclobacteriaceae bacterium]